MAPGTFRGRMSRHVRLGLVAGVLICAALVAALGPTLTASAADPTPVPTQVPGARLEKLLQRERNVLAYEQLRLSLANSVVKALEDFIADQKSQGKNTSALDEGVAAFRAAIASAQSLHDTAKTALDGKAGFNADGTVADFSQARETVKTAGKAERDFQRTMRPARASLWQALKNYRMANKGQRSI